MSYKTWIKSILSDSFKRLPNSIQSRYPIYLRSYLTVFLSIFFTCCGQIPTKGIDPAFNETLDMLQADFAKVGADVPVRSISIQFDDLEQDTHGKCVQGLGGGYILVDRKSWSNYTAKFKEYLLAHEIGHCILGRSHDEAQVQLSPFMPEVPESIMTPNSAEAANWATEYNDHYFSELVRDWKNKN